MGRIKPIRSAARAVIVREGRLLAVKMRDWRGIYYILPGGGQQPGETLTEAVRRECREEAGVEVIVQELLYVREYIGKNHNFSRNHHAFHQLEHVFRCEICGNADVRAGSETDLKQIGVEWLELAHIADTKLYPAVIKPFFQGGQVKVPELYLGDCN